MRILFILLILLPIIEIVVLVQVGSRIGLLPTIALVLATAMLGVYLLRKQSWETMRRAQEKMGGGQIPAKEMAEGLFLAVGGALLLTPGFVTDAIGFCCLLPVSRQLLMATLVAPFVSSTMRSFTMKGTTSFNGFSVGSGGAFNAATRNHQTADNDGNPVSGPGPGDGAHTTRPGDVIDGEFRREDD